MEVRNAKTLIERVQRWDLRGRQGFGVAAVAEGSQEGVHRADCFGERGFAGFGQAARG
jgi:hypothetical protein